MLGSTTIQRTCKHCFYFLLPSVSCIRWLRSSVRQFAQSSSIVQLHSFQEFVNVQSEHCCPNWATCILCATWAPAVSYLGLSFSRRRMHLGTGGRQQGRGVSHSPCVFLQHSILTACYSRSFSSDTQDSCLFPVNPLKFCDLFHQVL